MRSSLRLLVVLSGLLLSTALCNAQQIYADLGATVVDTISVVHTPSGGTVIGDKTKNVQEIWEILVLRTGTGGTGGVVLSIPVETIAFAGNGADSINNISAADLMTYIDAVSIREAMLNESIAPPAAGSSTTIRVYQAGCVARVGSGSSTHFVPGTSGPCVKTFRITTPADGGEPAIALIGSVGPNCSTFESTCESSSSLVFSMLDR